MRLLCAVVLAAVVSLLLPHGGGGPAQAKIVCGTFDGKFSCRNVPGSVDHGKNAVPGAKVPNPDDEPPQDTMGGAEQGTSGMGGSQGPAAAVPDATACQHGMVGTPPDNCRCPKNSELLGGNCVHYTASACSNGLAADALPQACRGVEEKVSCTLRQDGLKDCCCVTYDKF